MSPIVSTRLDASSSVTERPTCSSRCRRLMKDAGGWGAWALGLGKRTTGSEASVAGVVVFWPVAGISMDRRVGVGSGG